MTQTCKFCGQEKPAEAFQYKRRCLDCHYLLRQANAVQLRARRHAAGLTTRGTVPLDIAVIRQKNREGAAVGRDSIIDHIANQQRWAEAAVGVWFGSNHHAGYPGYPLLRTPAAT